MTRVRFTARVKVRVRARVRVWVRASVRVRAKVRVRSFSVVFCVVHPVTSVVVITVRSTAYLTETTRPLFDHKL